MNWIPPTLHKYGGSNHLVYLLPGHLGVGIGLGEIGCLLHKHGGSNHLFYLLPGHLGVGIGL
jgi:hypothetical protein